MSHRTAAWLVTGTHHLAERVRRADAEQGQGTVEYAGLAMAIGVLLLAVGSYLGGKDHGIGCGRHRRHQDRRRARHAAAAASRAGQRAALGVVATPRGAPPPR